MLHNKAKFIHYTFYTFAIVVMLFTFNVVAKNSTLNKSFEVSNGGTLTIDSDKGAIEIESTGKNQVLVEVRKKARNKKTLDEFEVNFNQSGDDIFIEGNGSWNDKVSVKYIIKVPSTFNLDLKTGGGSIKIGDLSGVIKLNTSGGSIKVDDVAKGSVDAHTSGGSIEVGDVNGNLKVNTSGGSITLGNVTGTSKINTSGGSIKLGSGGNNVNADTSGGSIKIGPVKGDVDVDTSGGSIVVGMTKGNVKADTSGGSIKVVGSTGKVNVDTSGGSIRIGSSGSSVKANTAGGSISIKQANGAIEADTAGGSIEAEMIAIKGDNHVELSSSGGDITLYIPTNLAATVDAKLKISRRAKRDYRIYSDFPLTIKGDGSSKISAQGEINGGGNKIRLSTTNGDIHIKKLEE